MVLIGGCATSGSSAEGQAGSVRVLHAGMVRALVRDGLGKELKDSDRLNVLSHKGNSVALANEIKAGSLRGDVYMSADASVNRTLLGPANGSWVSWFVVFARNEVVLAYSTKGKHAADFARAKSGQMPWYSVLREPGVHIGRDDPNRDPLGYYVLFAAQLAERYYRMPGLKKQLLGADDNPEQVLNTSTSLLQSGKLDAEFMYRSGAEHAGLPYVSLPNEINLGDTSKAAYYASASFTNDRGVAFHGAPIQVSAAPLRGAANPKGVTALLRSLMSGDRQKLLQRFDFLPSPVLIGGDRGAVPASLRGFAQGTYHSS